MPLKSPSLLHQFGHQSLNFSQFRPRMLLVAFRREDLGKNNRPKTEGRDKYRRRAVRFHVGQRDN